MKIKDGYEIIYNVSDEPDSSISYFNGYLIFIRRDRLLGYLCGYVGVTKDNLLFNYDNSSLEENDILYRLICHGGVTFCGPIKEVSIDHWFIGFDCSHFGDLIPIQNKLFTNDHFNSEGEYRTYDYVLSECESLAYQMMRINKRD